MNEERWQSSAGDGPILLYVVSPGATQLSSRIWLGLTHGLGYGAGCWLEAFGLHDASLSMWFLTRQGLSVYVVSSSTGNRTPFEEGKIEAARSLKT